MLFIPPKPDSIGIRKMELRPGKANIDGIKMLEKKYEPKNRETT
jgi:hypothetical protein